MAKNRYKRRIKLISPRLQLKLTLIFVGLSALSLMLQFILFTSSLTRVALSLPEDGIILLDEMNGFLIGILVTSFLIFLPLTFTVGVLTTFRIAGPLYRFEMFLKEVERGEKPDKCRLRKGDELMDFCELLNRVTAPLREPDEEPARTEGTEELRSVA